MINNKERDQIYRTGDTIQLKPEAYGEILDVGNAFYVSGSGGDDATVTFAQSASVEGDSYIKVTYGASSSTVTDSGASAAKYLFWDTGFRGYHQPSLCLTMDCSGSLESDLVTAANSGLPVVVFGWVWAEAGTAPLLAGNNGRYSGASGNGTINTWLAWRMGSTSDVDCNADADRGDTAFAWGSSTAARGTADGCRGFRGKLIGQTYIRDIAGVPESCNYYASWHFNTPGTSCDPSKGTQNGNITTFDIIPMDHKLYVFIGAGNAATGGDACTFAGIFKARIK